MFELFDAEVDLKFLLAIDSFPQLSRNETICRCSARLFSPDAFAGAPVQLAALQLAEPSLAADNRFDSDEIDEVIPVINEDGVTESDQATRFCASKAGRSNRPKECTTDAPHGLISTHAWADPIGSGAARINGGKGQKAKSTR
jgi:hypothetical protein